MISHDEDEVAEGEKEQELPPPQPQPKPTKKKISYKEIKRRLDNMYAQRLIDAEYFWKNFNDSFSNSILTKD